MKTYFAIVAAILVTCIAMGAHAKTFYFVNGKVATAAEANKAPDTAKVIKVQASQVKMNPETGRLKKSSDIELKDIPASK